MIPTVAMAKARIIVLTLFLSVIFIIPQTAFADTIYTSFPRIFEITEWKVNIGTSLEVTNSDSVAYSIVSEGINTGVVESGQTITITFDKAGTFLIYDGMNPSISSTVIVTNPYEPKISTDDSQYFIDSMMQLSGIYFGSTNQLAVIIANADGAIQQELTVYSTSSGDFAVPVKLSSIAGTYNISVSGPTGKATTSILVLQSPTVEQPLIQNQTNSTIPTITNSTIQTPTSSSTSVNSPATQTEPISTQTTTNEPILIVSSSTQTVTLNTSDYYDLLVEHSNLMKIIIQQQQLIIQLLTK